MNRVSLSTIQQQLQRRSIHPDLVPILGQQLSKVELKQIQKVKEEEDAKQSPTAQLALMRNQQIIEQNFETVWQYNHFLNSSDINLREQIAQIVLIDIVQKKEKSELELKFLLNAIINFKIFDEARTVIEESAEIKKTLEKNLQYELFEKREEIFRVGDFGNKFYIILQGQVDCLIPTTQQAPRAPEHDAHQQKKAQVGQPAPKAEDPLQNQEKRLNTYGILAEQLHQTDQKERRFKQKSSAFKKVAKLIATHQIRVDTISPIVAGQHSDDNMTDEQYYRKFYPGFTKVHTYTGGESFGEIALQTNQRRTATMICRNECHVLTLSKQGFDAVLKDVKNEKAQKDLEFLRKFEFFQHIPNSELLSFLFSVKNVRFPLSAVIYKEGDPCDQIYLIREGDLQISSSLVEEQPPDHSDAGSFDQHRKKRRKRKFLKLSLLSKNQFFGEYEILNKHTHRPTIATVTSETLDTFVIQKNVSTNSGNIRRPGRQGGQSQLGYYLERHTDSEPPPGHKASPALREIGNAVINGHPPSKFLIFSIPISLLAV